MVIVNNKELKMYIKLETQTEQERVVRALKGWQFDRKQHGCLYDRGSADSYYGRPRNPHYGGVGGDSGERVDQGLSIDEIKEYYAGYEYNERFGDKKVWR
jgi:hypothetical protein